MLDPRLSYAVAVARMASFTKAAELVGVTQSAITKSIADLERELGYSLFYRTSRVTLLTDEGRAFIERAARLLEDARELFSSVATADPYSGVLRIGVCPASLEWLLVDPLARLLQRHNQIRFEVIGGNFEVISLQLRGGALDVAVGFDEAFADWKDVTREPIAPLEATLFVRSGHPILALPKIQRSDLSNYAIVSPSDSRPYGAVIRAIYEEQDKVTNQYLHVIDYFPIVRQLVATSDAIGVVATDTLQSPAVDPRFAMLENVTLFQKQPLCCALRARWEPKPSVRAFLSVMKQALPPSA